MTRAKKEPDYWCRKCKRVKQEWPSENLRDPLVATLNEHVKDLVRINRQLRRENKELRAKHDSPGTLPPSPEDTEQPK